VKAPDKVTFREHAEAWWTEQGKTVPALGTPAWQAMYEQWVEYAFSFAEESKL
jgi:hypothetical protein